MRKFLFVLLTALQLVVFPGQAFAAPANSRQSVKKSPKSPKKPPRKKQKQTLTPTLEENLTPAQVARKIAVYRGRIVNAPEKQIPAKYKAVLLEAFDDMARTKMGRYILEKAHPNVWFSVKDMSGGAFYNPGSKEICINTRRFRDTNKDRLRTRILLAKSMIHELTHSVQFINRMNNVSNMSLEEKLTIDKLMELQTTLTEIVFGEQQGQLPEYRHTPIRNPLDLFYKDLKVAKMATGCDENTAERFARTKIAEAYWSCQKKAIRVGNKNISPNDLFIKASFWWNQAYSNGSSGILVANKLPPHLAMRDRGIAQNIRRFTKAMGIDTSPSFFRDPKTTPFDIPDSKTILSYVGGIKALEVRALVVGGRVSKRYDQTGRLFMVMPSLVEKQGSDGNRSYTEFHEGTNIKRATYTYRNGKMDGIYREYDREGKQISEIPFENGKMRGNGWAIENGKRVLKRFGGYTVEDIKR